MPTRRPACAVSWPATASLNPTPGSGWQVRSSVSRPWGAAPRPTESPASSGPSHPPLKPWARAQETARVPVEIDCSHHLQRRARRGGHPRGPGPPVEIDCSHHLQRHESGAVTGWEVLDVCAINKTLYETLGTRTVTLECSPPGSPCGRWRRRDENW
jgi:hypothetical protein